MAALYDGENMSKLTYDIYDNVQYSRANKKWMKAELKAARYRDVEKDKAFDMRSIINLDLSYNRIKYISSLYEYEKLKILNLNNNKKKWKNFKFTNTTC